MRTVHALCLSLALLAGCASVSTRAAGEPDYTHEAESNLRLGDEALENKDYPQAEKYYEYVRTKFPYHSAANEAELRLADLEFARERFPEARDKYRDFIKLHPTHPKVDYAAFRAALTHAEDIPSDMFLLPPSSEKDQTEVKAAQRALSDFLRQYPSSPHAAEAKVRLEDAQRRLAEHELYVASFYAKRERWKAVVQRLEALLERYPGTPHEEEALFSLHAAYVHLKDDTRAQDTLRRVIDRLPGTPAAERARSLLGS